ncbi:MAG: glycosyltransferase, partial [Cytophagia bacterium]
MNLAPVLIFAYNRFEHLQKTIESLSKNYLANQSEIFIYSDGEKTIKDHEKIKEIRTYLKNLKGFKKINLIFRAENLGLANSIIKGVSEIITIHKKVIVLEDDMISTPDFLNFMNDALLFYEAEKKIFTISGYNFPIKIPQNYQEDVFITQRASSW